MAKQYEVHPAAKAFPMMPESALLGLQADIEAHGQLEPITLWDGMLIDGRNRLLACERLNIEPRVAELDLDTDPVEWVISYNLHRRQLHPSQRAMIAAKMATLTRGKKTNEQNCSIERSAAAELLSVSERSLISAKHVLEHGSTPLIEAVEQREVTVSMAEKLCKACDDKREQTKLLKEGKKAIKEFLNPTPHEASGAGDSDVDDKYEYQIVMMFKHADYRLNTMKKLIAELTEAESSVLSDWLRKDDLLRQGVAS